MPTREQPQAMGTREGTMLTSSHSTVSDYSLRYPHSGSTNTLHGFYGPTAGTWTYQPTGCFWIKLLIFLSDKTTYSN